MHLPPEIVSQIIGHLVVPISGNPISAAQGWPRSWQHVIGSPASWAAYRSAPRGQGSSPYDSLTTCPDFQLLYTLRLVSHVWNTCACEVLQRHLWWCVDVEDKTTLERAVELCSRGGGSLGGNLGAMTPHVVGNLTIKYITHVRSLMKEYTYQRNRNPNPSEEFPWLNNYSVVEKPDSPNRYGRWSTVTTPMHIDRTSENTLLRKLFDTFTHLRGFSVSFPGAGTSHDGITQAVGCYDLPSYEMIMDSLVYGLRSAAFQNLVDLSVIVPGTHDVGRLAAALSDGVKSQLKHLWMSIVDKSGPGGSPGNRYEHDVDDEGYVYQDGTLEDIEESGYIPSNLQLKYPNREYQNEVWQFIKSCKTLESLGLKSTHYLDLTRLEWAPGSNSQGLKSLSLERIHTSAAALIALLGARDDEASAPALQRAKFRDVKIYGDGGLWGTVFEWMTKSCPDLEFFQPYNIGYLSPHPYFSFNNRPYENGRVIWTEGEADEPTMLRLIRKLVQKAGGPEYYPDHVEDYDWEIIDDQP